MGYLIGGIGTIGLIALALWGTGGMAALVLIPVLRIVPIVAAIFATVAFAQIANRFDAGPLPVIVFGASSILVSLTYVAPYLPSAGRYLNWLWWSAPVLTVLPAFALWHLAKAMNQRG
jgi:hypothetical protein